MAKKDENKNEEMSIEKIKSKKAILHLVGDAPLILCKKTDSFENEEIFKQSHRKGDAIPDELNSKLHYNLWEKLITSITWEKPYDKHENYEDYTDEEYKFLMENNRPCILSNAFMGTFVESFISYGYKESTSRTGADFKRCVRVKNYKTPVDITTYRYEQRLVPNNTMSHTNVLAQNNEFDGWSCDLEISYMANIFGLKTILSIVGAAGENLGIGTRRAEGYGTYHIEFVTEEK